MTEGLEIYICDLNKWELLKKGRVWIEIPQCLVVYLHQQEGIMEHVDLSSPLIHEQQTIL